MKLHLPAEQSFECTSCGRCCRASWTIAVEAPAEPAIRASQAYRDRARDGFQPLTLLQERVAVARKPDNSCTFLDQENLCELHRELGGTHKPLVCQTYPYLLTETPDGIFVTLSYACPAVSEGTGPKVEEQRAYLEQMLAARGDEMPQAPPVEETIEVTLGHRLAWPEYLKLEEELLGGLSAQDPVSSLLGAAVHLIWAEPQVGGGDFQRPPEGFGLARPYNFAGFDRQLASMVSCNLLATTEDVTDPQERAQLGSYLWNGGHHPSTRFGLVLPAFQLSRPVSSSAQERVARYLRGAIFGKRLLLGSVVSRLLALTCGVAILLFYVEAFSASGDDETTAFDRAFTLIESELLSHTRSFDGFFLEFEEALRNVRDELRA